MSTKYDINNIIDFKTNGDESELSELSDEEDDNHNTINKICKELNYWESSEKTEEPKHNLKGKIDNNESDDQNQLENIDKEDNVQLEGVTEN